MNFKLRKCILAQSTPPSTHRIRTIRRQSSVGAYHDSTSAPSNPQTTATTQHSSVPISSSTSYYTNSPSPPQAAEQSLVQALRASQLHLGQEQHLGHEHVEDDVHGDVAGDARADTANLPHSTVDTHSDNLVISRNQFDHINSKLELLARRVMSLEQTVASDVRLILGLLQAQTKEVAVKTEVRRFSNNYYAQGVGQCAVFL